MGHVGAHFKFSDRLRFEPCPRASVARTLKYSWPLGARSALPWHSDSYRHSVPLSGQRRSYCVLREASSRRYRYGSQPRAKTSVGRQRTMLVRRDGGRSNAPETSNGRSLSKCSERPSMPTGAPPQEPLGRFFERSIALQFEQHLASHRALDSHRGLEGRNSQCA
jgi:hypothetical protein